jgi:Putative beta-barrel porin-2, OmpL-like. bbp2
VKEILQRVIAQQVRRGESAATPFAAAHGSDGNARTRATVIEISAAITGRHPMHLSGKLTLALLAASSFLFEESLPAHAQTQRSRDPEVQQLRELVLKLQSRIEQLEKNQSPNPQQIAQSPASSSQPSTEAQPESAASKDDHSMLDFFRSTTFDFALDGYYGYNFNNPIGRVNLLRAYDVSSNAFSLNQANVIFKSDPDVAAGRRFGARLDLQFGQATSTLQGSPGNEPRPDVYRAIFQAFGTYVAPIGKGLTVDVGKWASSLGMEGNYTKDQMNYSRSYWFDFLPFYHMGARVNYKFNDKFAVNYWAVNGTQQTEPFNGFKDELIGFNLQPHKTVDWTMNYYLGQEHPDVIFFQNGGAPPNSPTEQGTPFQPISNAPGGKLHIIDSYLTWHSTPKLTLALEGDYVIERLLTDSAPAHTTGGALYARYQLTPNVGLAARTEYLSDRGGLFSGTTQALKEVTLTYEYKFAEGFVARTEYRRDFSNRPFFLTDQRGVFSNHQSTAMLGLVWWWGNKMGESW